MADDAYWDTDKVKERELERESKWLFTKGEILYDNPSVKSSDDDHAADKVTMKLLATANHIWSVSKLFYLKINTKHAALVFFRRFYTRHSIFTEDPDVSSCLCISLSLYYATAIPLSL